MFEKFGEFDSADDLNLAAEGFMKEGDMESLKELAKENGINEMDVEDYMDGVIETLATVMTAAMGRMEVEKCEIKDKKSAIEQMPLMVILEMTTALLMSDLQMPEAVMKKGKRIEQIYLALKDGASKHKSGNMGVSCGTDRQLKALIKTYYTRTDQELKTEIENMYK